MVRYGLKYNLEKKYVIKDYKIYSTTSLTKARMTAREIIASSDISKIWVVRLDNDDWVEGIVKYDSVLGWVFIPYSGTEAYNLYADGVLRDFVQPSKVKRAKYLVRKAWE